jgi:predicted DNA-binding transcriptional regulator YafY
MASQGPALLLCMATLRRLIKEGAVHKSERLFQLVNLLRGRRMAITAEQLAGVLEVTTRTIYRDIQTLQQSGIPIDGEAGIGYLLAPGFQLPPLMFDFEELQALLLGSSIVQAWTDPELARAAAKAESKIRAILPEALLQKADNQPYQVPMFDKHNNERTKHGILRKACDGLLKITINYQDVEQTATQRTLWPLGLIFWGERWTLLAWCELRDDFRNFRLDRIAHILVLETPFTANPNRSLKYFLDNCLY